MNLQFTYRQAVEKDIPFLVETIVAAEKSGTDRFSYATLFGITEEEAKNLLCKILEEDMQGQELCVSDFIIAEYDNMYAGACNAWVEGASGTASTIIKANLLMYYFGKEKCLHAAQFSDLLNELKFEREQGCLQLESAYVRSNFKGQGLASCLMLEQIKKHQQQYAFNKVQIIIAGINKNAFNSYAKIGFKVVAEKRVSDSRILHLLPSDHMFLLESNYTDLENYF